MDSSGGLSQKCPLQQSRWETRNTVSSCVTSRASDFYKANQGQATLRIELRLQHADAAEDEDGGEKDEG